MKKVRLNICTAAICLLLLKFCASAAAVYDAGDLVCTMNGFPAQGEFYYGDFAASLTLDTSDEQNNPPCVIAAQYDSRGALINCGIGKLSADGGAVTAELLITEVKNTAIRLYVWDSLRTMLPLLKECEILYTGSGTLPGQTVYYNEAFDDKKLSVGTVMKSGNTLTVENGFARMAKGSSDSCYFNMSFADGTSKHIILEADFRNGTEAEEKIGHGILFFVRDSATTGSNQDKNEVILKDGTVTEEDASVTLNSNPGSWTRISLALNLENGTYDLYFNGELCRQNLTIKSTFKNLNVWRIFLTGTSGTTVYDSGVLEIDNIRAYDGFKPRDILEKPVSVFSVYSDTEAKNQLSGKTALQPCGNVIWANNTKQKTDVPCIIIGDEALVSADTFEKLFGVKPVVSGSTVTAGTAVFTVGEASMKVADKTIPIDAAPEIADGRIMLPARAYGINVSGDKFYDDGHGLFVVSSTSVDTSVKYQEANQYLFFDRYSKSELTRRFIKTVRGDISKHPRVLADADDFARIREEVVTDKYKKAWYETVIKKADNYSADKTDFMDYDVSSGRLSTCAGAALNECVYGGMAYQLTGDVKYAERVIKVLMKVCTYPDWYPEHTLGTGTMAVAVGLGYDWCYDAMTDEQRNFIAESAKELGLGAGYDVYYGQAAYSNKFWGKTDTNWGGVVNGGFITLAAAIAEVDMDYTMQSLQNSLRSMEYPIYAIAPDGAWHEGPSYWSYFFGPLAIGMAAYESVIGEEHEAVYAKGMDGILTYREQVTGPTGKYNNYNDANLSGCESIARIYIGQKLSMDGIVKRCADNLLLDAVYVNNPTPEPFSLIWYDTGLTDINKENNLPLDAYYRETEFISMRQNWDSRSALWVSATGGVSNSSHSHLDSGSYVFALDGILWAKDLGTEPAYYSRTGGNGAVLAGYTNWHYYRRKAEGHNMVVINPDENLEIGKYAFAEMKKPVSGKGRAYSYVDLSSSYSGKADSYLRGYLLSDNRRAFTVRDEIDLTSDNSELYWFMHTDGAITVQNQTTALITKSGKTLKVQVAADGDDCEYTLCTMPQKRLLDLGFEEAANSGEKLTIRMTASGRVNITVKMSMLDEAPSLTPPENIPIAQWSAEE